MVGDRIDRSGAHTAADGERRGRELRGEVGADAAHLGNIQQDGQIARIRRHLGSPMGRRTLALLTNFIFAVTVLSAQQTASRTNPSDTKRPPASKNRSETTSAKNAAVVDLNTAS